MYKLGTLVHVNGYIVETAVNVFLKVTLLKALALTMLGHAAGGAVFSSRNGSTLFASDQTGYCLILPCIIDVAT